MSRPNHVPSPGLARDSESTAAEGSVLVNRLGQMAISAKIAIMVAEIQNIGLRRMARQASEASERSSPTSPPLGESTDGASMMACSVMADPRVEQPVEQVHEQVDEQVDDDEHGDRSDDGGTVTRADGPEDVVPDPGDVEDALGDDRAPE